MRVRRTDSGFKSPRNTFEPQGSTISNLGARIDEIMGFNEESDRIWALLKHAINKIEQPDQKPLISYKTLIIKENLTTIIPKQIGFLHQLQKLK